GCFQFGGRQDADDSDDNRGHALGSRLAGHRDTAYSRAVSHRHRSFVIPYVNAKHQCFGGQDPALLLVISKDCTGMDNGRSGVHVFGNHPAEARFLDIDAQRPNPTPSHELLNFFQEREPRLISELLAQLGRVAVEADTRSSCSTTNSMKKEKKKKNFKYAASSSAIFSGLPLYLAAETFGAAGGEDQSMGLPTPWKYVVAQPCSLRTPSWAMKDFSGTSLRPSGNLVPPRDHQDGPQGPEPTDHPVYPRQSRPPLTACRLPSSQASLYAPPYHEGGDVVDLPALLVR
ncbi:hypothetical protein Vretimale_16307, partial [Volvox reticuliferus]